MKLHAPTLSEAEYEQLRLFWEPYDAHREEISRELREPLLEHPEFATLVKSMTPEQEAAQDRISRALQAAAILERRWDDYMSNLAMQGQMYARQGISFSGWYEVIRLFRGCISSHLRSHYHRDPDRHVAAIQGMDRFVDIAMAAIGESYLQQKESIIANQQDAIREISTPVLQVRDRMLILPIIGMVDTHRARHLTVGLLKAIRDRRARVVVVDITGVPVVDSKVANHLIQTVEAANLMGAAVIITGISPEIAQTLVAIGANLGEVPTVGDLQEGVVRGEEILGLRTVPA